MHLKNAQIILLTLSYKIVEGGGTITTEDGEFEQNNSIVRTFGEELSFNFEFIGNQSGNHLIEWLVNDGRLQEKIAETKFFLEKNPDPDPFPDPDPDVNNIPTVKDDVVEVKTSTTTEIKVLLNDFDPEKGAIELESATNPENGKIEIIDGQLFYTSDAAYEGIDKFTYTVSDEQGLTNTGNVVVDVQKDLDQPPTVNNISATAFSGEEVMFDIFIDGEAIDPEGQDVTLDSVETPANGNANLGLTTISYNSNPDYEGIEKVNYTISDENGNKTIGTITITIRTKATEALEAVDDEITAEPGIEILIEVLKNDLDENNTTLVLISVEDGLNGSTIKDDNVVRYTSSPAYTGIDRFTYIVEDENGNQDIGIIVVTVDGVIISNTKPNAIMDVYEVDGGVETELFPLINDTDDDGDKINLVTINSPANGTLREENGKYFYTGNSTFSGIDRLSYVISDGKEESIGSIDITVNEETVPVTNPSFERELLSTGVDRDGVVNGKMSKRDADNLIGLNFTNAFSVNSLDDLKIFPNLETLNIRQTTAPTIDLSSLSKLRTLILLSTPFTTIDISNNKVLRQLNAKVLPAGLKTIITSGADALEWITIENSSIEFLNLNNNKSLTQLSIRSSNKISDLDVSGNPNLKRINLHTTSIGDIDLTNNIDLVGFTVNTNTAMKTIDLSKNLKLTTLLVWQSIITEVTANTNLLLDDVYFNFCKDLTKADISGYKGGKYKQLRVNSSFNLKCMKISNLALIEADRQANPNLYRLNNTTLSETTCP